MTAVVVARRRPSDELLAAARDAADRLVHEYAQRAARGSSDPLAYWLAGAAVAEALGHDPASWVRQARVAGGTWQAVADALDTTRGNVHGRFRWVDRVTA